MEFGSPTRSNQEHGDGVLEKTDPEKKDAANLFDPLKKSSGSTDDFEHVGGDDFLGTSNFKSDVGNELSSMISAAKEIPSDFMSAFDDKVAQTRDFMAAERGVFATPAPSKPTPVAPLIETIPMKEPTAPAEPINFFDSPVKKIAKEDNEKFISSEDLLGDFKDERTPPAPLVAAVTVVPPPKEEPPKILPEKTPKLSAPIEPVLPPAAPKPTTAAANPAAPEKTKTTPMISAEEMFCRFGLDAWFKPDRLHPLVESLIYWRDVKKSGIVFGAGLVILLAISCFSVISVFAYLSLLTLFGTVAFRIYKNVLGAIQKTSEGHPFKDYLEFDLTISQEKAQNVVTVVVAFFNGFISELRRLFLVDDLVDSIKFGVILWVLTYIGAWFNGMTLVILAFVALFTLPKVYENNKQSIDAYLDMVRSKIEDITDKVKAAIPIGKKQETEKDK